MAQAPSFTSYTPNGAEKNAAQSELCFRTKLGRDRNLEVGREFRVASELVIHKGRESGRAI